MLKYKKIINFFSILDLEYHGEKTCSDGTESGSMEFIYPDPDPKSLKISWTRIQPPTEKSGYGRFKSFLSDFFQISELNNFF